MNGQLQVCVFVCVCVCACACVRAYVCVRQLEGWILCVKSRMQAEYITCASAGILQAPRGVTICT